MRTKVIIDCDPGIDDTLAILFTLASRDINLSAITTVSGNVDISQATENVLKILELLRLDEPPAVGRGSNHPLRRKSLKPRASHGKDGLGNTFLPPRTKAKTLNAINLIVELFKQKGKFNLITTGPLTNIARLTRHFRGLETRVRELVISGGVGGISGYTNRLEDFNISFDPEAAREVFNAPIKKKLISLDVTSQILLGRAHIAHFKKFRSRVASFIVDILNYSFNYNRLIRKINGIFVHDAVVTAIALYGNLGRFENLALSVNESSGKITRIKGRPNMQLCTWVDKEKFIDMFIERLDLLVGNN